MDPDNHDQSVIIWIRHQDNAPNDDYDNAEVIAHDENVLVHSENDRKRFQVSTIKNYNETISSLTVWIFENLKAPLIIRICRSITQQNLIQQHLVVFCLTISLGNSTTRASCWSFSANWISTAIISVTKIAGKGNIYQISHLQLPRCLVLQHSQIFWWLSLLYFIW